MVLVGNGRGRGGVVVVVVRGPKLGSFRGPSSSSSSSSSSSDSSSSSSSRSRGRGRGSNRCCWTQFGARASGPEPGILAARAVVVE